MSLPLCPVCGLRNLRVVDVGAIIKTGEPGSPLRYSVTTVRSYLCRCGVSYRTSETIDEMNPQTLWVRKFAEDEARERA